jgi:hypothetical protein
MGTRGWTVGVFGRWVSNRSDKPVHFVASGQPAGFENFFPAVDALIKRAKPGSPEFIAELQKIAARCDMVLLEPAPR